MAKKEKYRIGMEIKSGRKKFLVLKVNKKTVIMREFKRKTKGNIVSLQFGDKYELPNE